MHSCLMVTACKYSFAAAPYFLLLARLLVYGLQAIPATHPSPAGDCHHLHFSCCFPLSSTFTLWASCYDLFITSHGNVKISSEYWGLEEWWKREKTLFQTGVKNIRCPHSSPEHWDGLKLSHVSTFSLHQTPCLLGKGAGRLLWGWGSSATSFVPLYMWVFLQAETGPIHSESCAEKSEIYCWNIKNYLVSKSLFLCVRLNFHLLLHHKISVATSSSTSPFLEVYFFPCRYLWNKDC